MTTDCEVVEIVEILSKSAAIVGKKFKNKEDLYKKPIKSSKLDIYIVKNKSENTNKWYISDIKKKMMILNFDNALIAIPILK